MGPHHAEAAVRRVMGYDGSTWLIGRLGGFLVRLLIAHAESDTSYTLSFSCTSGTACMINQHHSSSLELVTNNHPTKSLQGAQKSQYQWEEQPSTAVGVRKTKAQSSPLIIRLAL